MLRSFLSALGRVGIYLLAFIIGVVVVLSWYRSNVIAPIQPGATEKVYFEVKKGSTVNGVIEDLEKRQLIKNASAVSFVINNFKTDAVGKTIHAGEYELSPGMKPLEIYDKLTSGKTVQHPVLIPPGMSMNNVIDIIAKTGLASSDEIRKSMTDRTLMVGLDIPALIPEGYLFPETYYFSKPVTAEEMVVRIVRDGNKHMDAGIPNWKERAKEIGFTPYQVLTLASIIEKETGKPEERGLIASVFHNRLRIGMPLQSDPTVIYGIADFNGNLTKEHLKTPGPYNTYLNTGLPPTPICSPGLESLKAALYPEDTDYLYFVGKGDGSHHFSSTYSEHKEAVNNYQKIN